MKKTGTCPKCATTSLLHINKVAANTHTGVLQEQPTFRLAVIGKGANGMRGSLEAFACPHCGLVEFYLVESLRVDGRFVEEVERAGGPFR